MGDFLPKMVVSEETLIPCYFFFGEERFLAMEFIRNVEEAMTSPESEKAHIDRLSRENQTWAHIIDSARTVPFLFSTKRIILVELSRKQDENLNSSEKAGLKSYLSSPASQTVLIIVLSGKVTRRTPIVKFFMEFPSSIVCVRELKPLRGRILFSWIESQFQARGKSAAPDAQRRLVEIVGSDLARLHSEIVKIDTYLDEKKRVEADDVNEVSGWFKSFAEWEMTDNLESADCDQCFRVLDNLFREGTRPEYVLGLFVRFFRDVFMAKVWLKEKTKDKREIFKELKPQIQEKFGSFYKTKFKKFFDMVEGTNRQE
ncbi:MAG: DNA polymerase III subunit delta, partial [Candidatus Aminicenantes bacterium]|nr:DNA polymerase III subunit delta [Candidatus Aminicenantes bacterium]